MSIRVFQVVGPILVNRLTRMNRTKVLHMPVHMPAHMHDLIVPCMFLSVWQGAVLKVKTLKSGAFIYTRTHAWKGGGFVLCPLLLAEHAPLAATWP